MHESDEEEEDDTESEKMDVAPPQPSLTEPTEPEEVNLEDAFQGLFKTSASGTGEEELLRIASTYSRQISTRQIKAILYLEWISGDFTPEKRARVRSFVDRWLELKQYNNSDIFVMKALEAISLRKFIGENAFKVNIEK